MLSSIASAELVKSYFETGEIKAITNYLDGTNTEKKEGVKNGIEKVYYMEGMVANEVNYVNDKRDGALTWYDRDGKTLSTTNYEMGKLVGEEKVYHPNGKLKHIVNYVDDKQEGEQKEFFDNGQLASQVTYLLGKKTGVQKEYTYEGELYTQVPYKDNLREGDQNWYDEKGNIVNTIFYKSDRPLKLMKKVQETNNADVIITNIDFTPQNARD